MIDRRDFLKLSALAAAYPHSTAWAEPSGIIVNDIHSQLNATRVRRIAEPSTLDALHPSCIKLGMNIVDENARRLGPYRCVGIGCRQGG